MSLKFPISLTSKKSSDFLLGGGQQSSVAGVDLTEDLVRWWEDGNLTDKHNSITLGAVNTNSTDIPSPFTSAFAPSRSEGAITSKVPVPDFTKYTIFMLWRRNASAGDRPIFQSKTYDGGDCMQEYMGSNRFRVNDTAFGSYTSAYGDWHTVVYSKAGATATVYIDGSEHASVTGTGTPGTGWWRIWNCQKSHFCIFGIADRSWTIDDAIFFHNDGSYVKYADL